MPYGDPINTLAQWAIWRIELRVLSSLIAGSLIGLTVLAYFIFGDVVADYAGYVIFGVPILMFVGAVIWFFKLLIFGPALNDKLFDTAQWQKQPPTE